LLKGSSSETIIPTLLEVVQENKIDYPYKKGTYQQGHNFLRKIFIWSQENVSTAYIFNKPNLKILITQLLNFIVSKVFIRKISVSIIFKKQATIEISPYVACRTFLYGGGFLG